MKTVSLNEFYQRFADAVNTDVHTLLPPDSPHQVGHFNLFNIADQFQHYPEMPLMPYDRRAYYKISLVRGRSRVEYANKVIDIEQNALLFATPKVPYYWRPQDPAQAGRFCVFTSEFLLPSKSGVWLEELPIFRADGHPVFQVSDQEWTEIDTIFRKMELEINSQYAFKYDLLRTYLLELIHAGQKLQPALSLTSPSTGSARVTALFMELLERQFPLNSPLETLQLRTASDYADRLAVHVNHLNKTLKEHTGRSTTELVGARVLEEAKRLLLQSDWTISQISDCLGFTEVAHFSRFFKRHTQASPIVFRGH